MMVQPDATVSSDCREMLDSAWAPCRPRRRRGHSLIEIIVALPLALTVLGTAGIVVFIASRSRLLNDGPLREQLQSHQLLERVLRDVRAATSVADQSPHSIEFGVPDRNGDGERDDLRYEWSGVPGDPALLYMNDLPPEVVAEKVYRFDLAYTIRTLELLYGQQHLSVIKYHNDARRGDMEDWRLESGTWCAQFFLPDLPGDATSWQLDQVRFMAKSWGSLNGLMKVKVTTASPSLQPTANVLEEVILPETELDSDYAWVTLEFWTLKGLALTQGLCIVLAYEAGTDMAAKIRYEDDGENMTPNTHMITSANSGQSWSYPGSDKDLRFFVYGKHNGTASSRQFLTSMDATVQVGALDTARAQSATHLRNAPEIKQ